MKTQLLLFTTLLLTTLCFGQNGIIKATIIEADSKKPIPSATIILYGTTVGTITDAVGNFTLEKIPAKPCEIIIADKDIQFLPFIVTNVPLGKNKKVIDLGNIPLIKGENQDTLPNNYCLVIDNINYKVNFIEGDYRYIRGKVAILYMDKPELGEK